MEPHSTQQTQQPHNEQNDDKTSIDELLNDLPKNTSLGAQLVQYQGFWVWNFKVQHILSFQTHFEAKNTDLFITGMPKTGNTWLKSLVFSTLYRHQHPISSSPLLHHNPHELIPNLEIGPYSDVPTPNLGEVLKYQGSPRLLATHLPHHSLPQTIKDLKCCIIYIYRNPLDTFVSSYFFTKGIVEKRFNVKFPTLEEYFELYLQGITSYGPFFDHVLGYWKTKVEMPDKVLFIKYEELKKDTTSQLKRIAEFIKQPFSLEEEQVGVIEEIIKLCSIKSLKELNVNKDGKYRTINNELFFRKGEVGDSTNHLTPSMIDRMHELMHQKLPF